MLIGQGRIVHTREKRKHGMDLLIIGISMLLFYGILGIFYLVLKIDMGNMPLLLQTFLGAVTEYGLLGLGITIVCILRKESFASFGLKREKLLLTILLSALVCLPSFLHTLIQDGNVTYLPFQGVNFTRAVLASGFPVNIAGMLLIITSWGFFEGFTYTVLYDRINKLLPAKNLFINWGAIICGVFCVAIHLIGGQAFGIGHILDFVIIYGMLVVYQYTGNAWGCVLIYCFFWNAV